MFGQNSLQTQSTLPVGHHSKTILQKTSTQQNRSICFGNKTTITNIDKEKAININNSQMSLHIAETKSTNTYTI